MKLIPESLEESLNFQRGIDPKTSMRIGDAAILPELIDSNILQAVSMFDDYSEEEYKENVEIDDPEELNYEFIKRVKEFLKGKVTFGRGFDWKEENAMVQYISKNARGRYVYNSLPGADGWEVVFSKIYFPRAEAINI